MTVEGRVPLELRRDFLWAIALLRISDLQDLTAIRDIEIAFQADASKHPGELFDTLNTASVQRLLFAGTLNPAHAGKPPDTTPLGKLLPDLLGNCIPEPRQGRFVALRGVLPGQHTQTVNAIEHQVHVGQQVATDQTDLSQRDAI